jgi:hypothetical protein
MGPSGLGVLPFSLIGVERIKGRMIFYEAPNLTLSDAQGVPKLPRMR